MMWPVVQTASALPTTMVPVSYTHLQQGRAPVDKGIRLFGSGLPAIRHDLFRCGGTGLGLCQNGVEVFQLHPVALQGFQIQLRLGQDVLVQELPEVGEMCIRDRP